MKKIIIPTFIKYAFSGGVGETIRMLAKYSDQFNCKMYDISGVPISSEFKVNRRTLSLKMIRKISHLKMILFFKYLYPKSDMIFFQTSLNSGGYLRDIQYIRKCVKFNRSFSVFIHGWNDGYSKHLESKGKGADFAKLLNHAHKVIVLSHDFKVRLVAWGVESQKVIVETTMVDNSLLHGFSIEHKLRRSKSRKGLNILFLSRISKEKGIHEALEAFKIHQVNRPDSTLTFAGSGPELLSLKREVYLKRIRGVRFAGFVQGAEKIKLFSDADVFLLPTYGEGMPISVLEAMAFGCVVITRPVGGLKTFFLSPEMGYLEEGLDPTVYSEMLNQLDSDRTRIIQISKFNHDFAMENLLASNVCKRLFKHITM